MQDVQTSSKRMLGRLFGLILAKLLSPLASFLVIVLIARIWGRNSLGQYNTVLAWYAIFQFVTVFGMTEYISREVGKDHRTAAKYLSHGLLFGLFSSLICVGLMAGGAILLNYPKELKHGIMVAGLVLPFSAWILMCQSIFTAFQKIKYIALTSLVEAFFVFVFATVVIFKQYGVIALIWSLVIAKALSSAFNLFVVHRGITRVHFQFDGGFLLKLLPPVVVFGLTSVAFQIFMRVDVIMLSRMKDMATVGLYSSASKLTEICLMFPLAFYVLNLPIAAKGYKSFPGTVHHKLQSYTRELFILVFFVFGFGTLFSKEILELIYGKPFLGALWPLRILLLAYLIQCADMVLGMSCQAAGYHKFAMVTAVIRAVSNIGLNFIFILVWGMYGAALATLISISLSFVIFQSFVIKKLHGFDWVHIIVKPALVCLFTIFLLFSLANYTNLFFQAMVYLFGYCGILLALNRLASVRAKRA